MSGSNLQIEKGQQIPKTYPKIHAETKQRVDQSAKGMYREVHPPYFHQHHHAQPAQPFPYYHERPAPKLYLPITIGDDMPDRDLQLSLKRTFWFLVMIIFTEVIFVVSSVSPRVIPSNITKILAIVHGACGLAYLLFNTALYFIDRRNLNLGCAQYIVLLIPKDTQSGCAEFLMALFINYFLEIIVIFVIFGFLKGFCIRYRNQRANLQNNV